MPNLATRTRVSQFTSVGLVKFKFVPRHQELRSLEGVYQVQVETDLDKEYTAYTSSGGKMRFSKWLSSYKGVGNPSEVCKRRAESKQEVRLTCRFNDLLRMSDTKNYDACTQPGRFGATAVAKVCRDPNIALLVTVGPSGHFTGRVSFRRTGEKRVALFRAYGTLSLDMSKELFQKLGYEVEDNYEDLVIYMNQPNDRLRI